MEKHFSKMKHQESSLKAIEEKFKQATSSSSPSPKRAVKREVPVAVKREVPVEVRESTEAGL